MLSSKTFELLSNASFRDCEPMNKYLRMRIIEEPANTIHDSNPNMNEINNDPKLLCNLYASANLRSDFE